MRTFSNSGRRLLVGAIAILAAAGIAGAAEMRTWTNLKGQAIKAQLLAVDGDNVRLRMDTGRDVTIPRKTLSAGDQKYLTEYGGAKEVPLDPKAKVGMPARSMKFDSKTLIRRDDKFDLPEGFSLEFDIIESEHFLVMSSGKVRGKDTAELAERLWYSMSFQHPGFKDKWGDDKRAIFLCGEDADYKILGEYYVQNLQNMGRNQDASNSALTWNKASAGGFQLTNDVADKYGVKSGARAFKAADKRRFKSGVWNPFPTHCIAQDVLREMMGGAGGGAGSEGYFAVTTGHAYFKEIQLTGETVTTMIDANTYESDEITKAGGFDDGKKWARALRDLVKKEKVTLDLAALYRIEDASGLTPELTVSMYSLARYMQSTPPRLAKFSEFMNRVDTSRAIPVPQETAKIFGFETVSEFEEDWSAYVKSTSFK